jgi:nitroimidazol reductase NimA-like FMN-containing flavoprotein (pyridoxamine 5'-phosphate oxidase superfamily)
MDETVTTGLTREECFELLARTSVGRIGVSIDALPVIHPIHFTLMGDSVLFRTVPGTRLDSATIGTVVAFEAEGWEPADNSYWSVLLQGIAAEVSATAADPESTDARAKSASIKTWRESRGRRRLVRLERATASGRRFQVSGGDPREDP